MTENEKVEFLQKVFECIDEALELDSDDSDKDDILTGLANLGEQAIALPTKRRKRKWVKEWRHSKEESGSFAFLSKELLINDEESYNNYLRVSKPNFDFLLSLIRDGIQRSDTNMRRAIPAEEKLALTLRFLATGETYVSLDYQTRLSKSAISKIIPEVCDALYARLKSQYLKFPSSHGEWEEIAKEFAIKWQFPNCLGALDGKHITFRPPRKDGAFFYNYKGTNSIILLALVDANCKFIYVNVGCNGRNNDSGVFLQSQLHKVMEEKKDLPAPSTVGNGRRLPYVVIGDDAFPLQINLMKPYPFHSKSKEKQIYNKRLSRGRHTVEHAFGILSSRFRVFLAPMGLSVETVQSVTLACCALHNFLIDCGETRVESTADSSSFDTSEIVNEERVPYNPRRGEAESIRKEFTDYFNDEGRLDWLQPN